MYTSGHHVASHTWTHANLSALDRAGVISEMQQIEDAFMNILNVYPAYMRPPYLEVGGVSLEVLTEMEYYVVTEDVDSLDWENLTPQTIPISLNTYETEIGAGGTLSLTHDPLNNTANWLIGQIVTYLNSKGLKCKSFSPIAILSC
jgi:peptidoglycan/xylan/chitin deacetylase (PgdA/CDA1 family)